MVLYFLCHSTVFIHLCIYVKFSFLFPFMCGLLESGVDFMSTVLLEIYFLRKTLIEVIPIAHHREIFIVATVLLQDWINLNM